MNICRGWDVVVIVAIVVWIHAPTLVSADVATQSSVVILPFHGPKSVRARVGVIRALRNQVQFVRQRDYFRVAGSLGIDPYESKNVPNLCGKIGCDFVLRGMVTKRDSQYLVVNRVISGKTGALVGVCQSTRMFSRVQHASKEASKECIRTIAAHRNAMDSPPRNTAEEVVATVEGTGKGQEQQQPSRSRANAAVVASEESGRLLRFALRSTIATQLSKRINMVVGGGATYIREQGDSVIKQGLLGISLRIALGRAQLTALAAGYLHQEMFSVQRQGALSDESVTTFSPAGGGAIGYQSHGIHTQLRIHRRPFIELAQPLATDAELFYSAGVGGAAVLEQVRDLTVKEVQASVRIAPSTAWAVFANGRGFQISDSNRGYVAWAGGEFDVLSILSPTLPLALYATWAGYVTSYGESRGEYFSPTRLHSQSVGGKARLQVAPVSVTGYGGLTYSHTGEWSRGWYAGGHFHMTKGKFVMSISGEMRKDPYYDWRAMWISAGAQF